uniref:Bestrophin homolog n=1 Tax=Rodentolepis nana TaxID=102285 RepID=A0A0R3T3I7_RODNA
LFRSFANYCAYCAYSGERLPIYFVLGFFVDTIVARWWEQFCTLPWPDELAMLLCAYSRGNSDRVRMQRRTVMRYMNLAYVFASFDCCSRTRLRFPSEFSLISAGMATEQEIFTYIHSAPLNNVQSYMMPTIWADNLILQMRQEGSIVSDRAVEILLKEIMDFRGRLGTILCYDWISLPLVYTQIATLIVYSYTVSCIFSWQFSDADDIDIYIPLFGLLHFVFYMGWLKVAESMINPFGEDQDDFELDEIVERNLQISFQIVDSMYDTVPPLSRGVVLDNFESDRRASAASVGPRLSTVGNELFSGSLVNVNVNSGKRTLSNIFGISVQVRLRSPSEFSLVKVCGNYIDMFLFIFTCSCLGFHIPTSGLLYFFLYMGWLKVNMIEILK